MTGFWLLDGLLWFVAVCVAITALLGVWLLVTR